MLSLGIAAKYKAYTTKQTALLVSSLSTKASKERVEREAHSVEACASLWVSSYVENWLI